MKKMLKFLALLAMIVMPFSTNAAILEADMEFADKVEKYKNKRICYYTASFSPVHNGYEDIVNKLLDSDMCEYLVLHPTWGAKSHKNVILVERVEAEHRINMLLALYENHPRVLVSVKPTNKMQEALTYKCHDQMMRVHDKMKKMHFVGVIDTDVVKLLNESENSHYFMEGRHIGPQYYEHTLGGWHGYPAYHFVLMLREGEVYDDKMKQDVENAIGRHRHVIKVIENVNPLTSEQIRDRLFNEQSIRGLVRPEVLDIIINNNLYYPY